MERKRIPSEPVQALSRLSPKREIWAGAGVVFTEQGIMNANDDFPKALECGLFCVGSAGNGDPIAIDIGPGAGAVGYIDHETMREVKDVRDVFIPIGRSIGAVLYHFNLGDDGLLADDYHDAKERLERK